MGAIGGGLRGARREREGRGEGGGGERESCHGDPDPTNILNSAQP